MYLGLSLHALTRFDHDVRPFDEALRLARAAGAEHVMLLSQPGGPPVEPGRPCPGTLVDLPACHPGELLWRVTTAGLWISCVYTGAIELATDEEARACLPGLRALAALACRLGVGILAHGVGRAGDRGLPTTRKTARIERLAGLMEAVTGEFGLRTAADIHVGGAVESVDDACYYLAVAGDPRVGLLLNIGHLTTAEQPGWELLAREPERIPIIAWKDHLHPPPDPDRPVVSVEAGQGGSPFDRYVRVLKGLRRRPLGLVAFEHVAPANQAAAARRSLAYLREIWRRAGLIDGP